VGVTDVHLGGHRTGTAGGGGRRGEGHRLRLGRGGRGAAPRLPYLDQLGLGVDAGGDVVLAALGGDGGVSLDDLAVALHEEAEDVGGRIVTLHGRDLHADLAADAGPGAYGV